MTIVNTLADVAAYALNLAPFGFAAATLARIARVECDDTEMAFFDASGEHLASFFDRGHASYAYGYGA
jgi:hypothetical protein